MANVFEGIFIFFYRPHIISLCLFFEWSLFPCSIIQKKEKENRSPCSEHMKMNVFAEKHNFYFQDFFFSSGF